MGRGGIIIMQCSMLDGEIIDFSMGEWIWGKRVIIIYSLQNNIYHLSKQINLTILSNRKPVSHIIKGACRHCLLSPLIGIPISTLIGRMNIIREKESEESFTCVTESVTKRTSWLQNKSLILLEVTPKARQPLLDRSSQNSQLVCIKST